MSPEIRQLLIMSYVAFVNIPSHKMSPWHFENRAGSSPICVIAQHLGVDVFNLCSIKKVVTSTRGQKAKYVLVAWYKKDQLTPTLQGA